MIHEYFDPVKAWHKAMDSVGEKIKLKELAKQESEKVKRKEQARKTAEALLAKNPNHFRELAALSNRLRKTRGHHGDQ
jgi:ABC-type transport system involved in cytochrome bd biosynthesis fused ATPase/permease subunit